MRHPIQKIELKEDTMFKSRKEVILFIALAVAAVFMTVGITMVP